MKTSMNVVVKNFYELNKEEQDKYAEIFCEGDDSLKSLLLYLWKNKINTFGCCIGHEEEKQDTCYISFDIQNIDKQKMEKILFDFLLYFEKKANIACILKKSSKKHNKRRMLSLSLNITDEKRTQFFEITEKIFAKHLNNFNFNFKSNYKLSIEDKLYIKDLLDIVYLNDNTFYNDKHFADTYLIMIWKGIIEVKNKYTFVGKLINLEEKRWYEEKDRNNEVKQDLITKYLYYKLDDNKFLVTDEEQKNLKIVDKQYIVKNKLKDARKELKKVRTKYSHNNFLKKFKIFNKNNNQYIIEK